MRLDCRVALALLALLSGCHGEPPDLGRARAASGECSMPFDLCDDGNLCTVDRCDTMMGMCVHVAERVGGCCLVPSDCMPVPCTTQRCEDNVCVPAPIMGCDGGLRPDASTRADAGPRLDAGSFPDASGAGDAAAPVDAGARRDGGRELDAGSPPDASGGDGALSDGGQTTAHVRGGACRAAPGGDGPLGWILFAMAWLGLRRRRAARGLAPLAVVMVLAASPAEAQGFRLDASSVPALPDDLLALERAAPEPGAALRPGLRVGRDYADDPLVAVTSVERPIVAERLTLGAVASVAAWRRLFVSAGGSMHLQSGLGSSAVSPDAQGLESPAAGAPVIDARVVLLDRDEPIELALAATLRLPVGSTSGFGADATTSFAPRVLLARAFDERGSFLGLSLGVDLREEVGLGDLTVGPALTWALGAAGALGEHAAATLELAGSTVLARAFDAAHTPLEGTAGLRWHQEPFTVAVAVGAGLSPGFGTPDARARLVVSSWIPIGDPG